MERVTELFFKAVATVGDMFEGPRSARSVHPQYVSLKIPLFREATDHRTEPSVYHKHHICFQKEYIDVNTPDHYPCAMKSLFIKTILLCFFISAATIRPHYQSFREDFDSDSLKHFRYASGGNQAAFTRTFGVESSKEPGTNVMSFKIDPNDPPGAGRGPEIISNEYTHYGKYSARLRVPDPRSEQPNVGAVVGYFTYHMDSVFGLSEIDFEWLIADPTVIYVGTWTGPDKALKRIGRTINLAKGIIYETTYREGHQGRSQR